MATLNKKEKKIYKVLSALGLITNLVPLGNTLMDKNTNPIEVGCSILLRN